ncbi:MAG TPA: RsmG family class I SAM-dependent methyltransferase, partial [Coriobacteriia bacterium]|nr:RsmG family class I SAM-dependent methyltransferase [Coriobacteriia bacterium]
GSGAGYPGIPLAVLWGTPVDLLEPTRKKSDFLASVVAELGGLNRSHVFPLRAEQLAVERPARYRFAVARAVAALPSLVELACPLLEVGGTLAAMKGTPTSGERESGRIVAEMLGMIETGWSEYQLPFGGERRTVAQYTKNAEPSRSLPRRVGMAQKRPLA